MKTNPLLERLISLSKNLYKHNDQLIDSKRHQSLIDQISRSSSSAALNYAESIVSATDKDYANKVRIALKEMNETCTSLILLKARTKDSSSELTHLQVEADELVAMLSTCCRKAESKFKKGSSS